MVGPTVGFNYPKLNGRRYGIFVDRFFENQKELGRENIPLVCIEDFVDGAFRMLPSEQKISAIERWQEIERQNRGNQNLWRPYNFDRRVRVYTGERGPDRSFRWVNRNILDMPLDEIVTGLRVKSFLNETEKVSNRDGERDRLREDDNFQCLLFDITLEELFGIERGEDGRIIQKPTLTANILSGQVHAKSYHPTTGCLYNVDISDPFVTKRRHINDTRIPFEGVGNPSMDFRFNRMKGGTERKVHHLNEEIAVFLMFAHKMQSGAYRRANRLNISSFGEPREYARRKNLSEPEIFLPVRTDEPQVHVAAKYPRGIEALFDFDEARFVLRAIPDMQYLITTPIMDMIFNRENDFKRGKKVSRNPFFYSEALADAIHRGDARFGVLVNKFPFKKMEMTLSNDADILFSNVSAYLGSRGYKLEGLSLEFKDSQYECIAMNYEGHSESIRFVWPTTGSEMLPICIRKYKRESGPVEPFRNPSRNQEHPFSRLYQPTREFDDMTRREMDEEILLPCHYMFPSDDIPEAMIEDYCNFIAAYMTLDDGIGIGIEVDGLTRVRSMLEEARRQPDSDDNPALRRRAYNSEKVLRILSS